MVDRPPNGVLFTTQKSRVEDRSSAVFVHDSCAKDSPNAFQTPQRAGVSGALFVAVMVGDGPNTTVVPLASSILFTNLPLSHSVFQCTS